jgi:hypothetical protein
MRRAVLLGFALAAVATGCTREPTPSPPSTAAAAPPQEAMLDWVERTSAAPPRLVFEVERIEVTVDGWQAIVAIANETDVSWTIGDPFAPSDVPFGVMLFASGDLDELERRNRDRTLPGIRDARTVSPAPPPELAPGARWEATISAPGALAAGSWLRVTFGPLITREEPPEDIPQQLLWISDNAHLLHG